MPPIPLSVFIIAKNEEDRIPFTLESLHGWVDEIIVIDSGSSDRTREISESYGARVLHHSWQGYGPQKIFGEQQCRNDWILNLDADESVSEALAAEIQALFAPAPACNAYHLPIKILHRTAQYPGRFAPSNQPIRLYHKQYAGFKSSIVHDSVVAHAEPISVGTLKHIAIHRCFRSYTHAVEKINYYSSMQATDLIAKGRVPSRTRIIIEPFFAFLKAYTLRRYFLLGIEGFIESILYAFARTLRLAKARELAHLKKQTK